MPSRNEHARNHARAWLRDETPIADDASLAVLQEEAAALVRDAKLRDPSAADVRGVLDDIARAYFRHRIGMRSRETGSSQPASDVGNTGGDSD
jgi:hypothetical protein